MAIPTDAHLNLRKMNLRHFCRDAGSLTRDVPSAELPRVLESMVEKTDAFSLALQGYEQKGSDGTVTQHLTLTVSGHAPLVCQRCLEPVSIAVQSTAQFVLVNTDEQADEMLEAQVQEGDDESPEPLVVNKPVDVIELAEDEVLLSLPIVAMHEQCPKPLVTSKDARADEAFDEQAKPNPFAVLAGLKKKPDTH